MEPRGYELRLAGERRGWFGFYESAAELYSELLPEARESGSSLELLAHYEHGEPHLLLSSEG